MSFRRDGASCSLVGSASCRVARVRVQRNQPQSEGPPRGCVRRLPRCARSRRSPSRPWSRRAYLGGEVGPARRSGTPGWSGGSGAAPLPATARSTASASGSSSGAAASVSFGRGDHSRKETLSLRRPLHGRRVARIAPGGPAGDQRRPGTRGRGGALRDARLRAMPQHHRSAHPPDANRDGRAARATVTGRRRATLRPSGHPGSARGQASLRRFRTHRPAPKTRRRPWPPR